MLKITFLGHACFLLDDGETKVLTDPYLSGNPLAAVSADEVEADYIFVSHGHGDHVGDTAGIAARCGAAIGGPVEITGALFGKQGLETIPGNIGGLTELPFGSVKVVPAIHGSGVPGALACGFVFEIGGKKVYFAGDTALTKDMELLEYDMIDAALLPIGDVYTMGPEDAARAAWMIRPRRLKKPRAATTRTRTMPKITTDRGRNECLSQKRRKRFSFRFSKIFTSGS